MAGADGDADRLGQSEGMRRLIVSAQMTLDAVIDHTDAWFSGDGDHAARAADELFTADAMLLGRRTYEGLSTVWPKITDDTGFAQRVNTMPKYVVSRRYDQPMRWNASLLTGDLIERVTQLKQKQNLLVYGCGELAYELTKAGLVDEIRLVVHPIVFRNGTRIFSGDDPIRLDLVSTIAYRSGLVELAYRPKAQA